MLDSHASDHTCADIYPNHYDSFTKHMYVDNYGFCNDSFPGVGAPAVHTSKRQLSKSVQSWPEKGIWAVCNRVYRCIFRFSGNDGQTSGGVD